MLRWGLLGASRIADARVAAAMRAAGHDLAVVGARSLMRAQHFAARHGVRRARGSYEEVLEAADVDAVYIALPNDLHEPWAVAALGAGKHVLCEKPMAMDAAAAGRMAAASGAHGRLVMEALMTRFHPRTAALLELVRGGDVGEVRHISATFAFTMDRSEDYRARPEHGGGALLDVGVYGVALSRWLVSEEPNEWSTAQRLRPSAVDGATAALLGFPSGTTASVYASHVAAPAQRLTVLGSTGTLETPDAFTAGSDTDAVLLRDGREVGAWRADPYELMVRAFGDAVSAGAGTAPLPADDAVATATVLDRLAGAAPVPAARS